MNKGESYQVQSSFTGDYPTNFSDFYKLNSWCIIRLEWLFTEELMVVFGASFIDL